MPAGKLIYLARRNPGLSREQFMRRWRQHCALAMGLPRWNAIQRIAYCDVLPPIPGLDTANADFDGVGTIWFRNETQISPDDRTRLRDDELETFSHHVDTFSRLTDESVLRSGAGLVKASVFFKASAISGTDDGLARHGARMLSLRAAACIRRYVLNRACAPVLGGKRLVDFDDVTEYWFDTVDDLRTFFAEADVREALSGSPDDPFGRTGNHLVVTNEVVLYDRALAG